MDPSALGSLWNSFRPITKLLDEILVEIFLCTGAERGAHDNGISPVELTRYMLVCWRWRSVIVSHACFWGTIVVKKRSEWLQIALPRSQLAMVHLESDASTLASVLSDVIPHRDRIRSLELGKCRSYAQVMGVSSLIQAPFKSLTRLHIKSYAHDRPDFGPYLLFLPEHYPQLTHLTLRGLHVQWTESLLSRLTLLYLSHCSIWPSLMDGDAFLDVLQQGRRLEDLTLSDFISAACSVVPSRSRRPFTFPRLTDLLIVDEERWFRQFMAFVRAPRPRQLTLRTGDVGTDDLDNAPTSPQVIMRAPDVPFFLDTGVRAHIHASTTVAAFNMWHRASDMQCTSYTLAFPLPGMVLDFSPMIQIFGLLNGDIPELSTLSVLDLKAPMCGLDRDTLDAYFDAAPHLRWLHIGCGRDASFPLPPYVFDSLSTRSEAPDADSNGSDAAVRCPKLTYLGLGGLDWDGGAVMDAALGCLRTRAALGVQQLEHLAIRVRPRPPEEEPEGGWGPAVARYATQLQEMVSHQFSFAVGPECGVY